jgi:glutamate-1-semialdehyde 2,1-aminomutase
MGLVQPRPGFLEGLRALCDRHGALLIFDEVITGFRLCLGGAQEYFGVRPDLATFGKVIGGGLPVGAYGGRADVMGLVAPLGPVYQAGTLSGNPLAMAAGLATLEAVAHPGFYDGLEAHAASLQRGFAEVLSRHGQPARVDRLASIFYVWFAADREEPPASYDDIKSADAALFGRFHAALLAEGVAFAPSAFEVGFVSAAHQQEQIDATITAVDRALSAALR